MCTNCPQFGAADHERLLRQQEMSGSDALSQSSLSIGLFLGCLILLLPRRYALTPMLVAGCYMTLGQALVVGPMHLYLIRILILFAVVRVVVRKELFSIKA